jgi:hypothetical protein
MIPETIADEFPIRLSTGETILVAEIDAERSPALQNKDVRAAVDGLLRHCTHVSREIIEEAKAGYDTRFKPLLRAAPHGCMAKANPHQCRLITQCAMAHRPVCTLHNIATFPSLPICWEFDPPPVKNPMIMTAAIDLGTVIGDAWRRDLYVLIVDN